MKKSWKQKAFEYLILSGCILLLAVGLLLLFVYPEMPINQKISKHKKIQMNLFIKLPGILHPALNQKPKYNDRKQKENKS